MYPIFNTGHKGTPPPTKKDTRTPVHKRPRDTDKLERSAAIHVAKRRRLPETSAALARMPVNKLLEMMGTVSPEEKAEAQRHVTALECNPLYQETRGTLDQMARFRGIAPSTHTKTSLVEAILETPELPVAPVLSVEQALFVREFLVNTKAPPRLDSDGVPFPDLLHAGPGTGKTTTLGHAAMEYMACYPESRVLFLTYTRAGVQAIVERLGRETRRRQKLLGPTRAAGPTGPGTGCKKMDVPGVHVCSFHQYASKRLGRLDDDASSSVYDIALARGTKKGAQAWEDWGLVIIDEAQDVISKFVTLIGQVRRCARHTLIAGDPRQELYNGASYFSRLCCTPGMRISYLQTNFRSNQEIVQTLNVFSRAHFGTEEEGIHKDQLASTLETKPSGVTMEIVQCSSFGDNQRELVARVCEHLAESSGSACCISPVTVKKYKTSPLVAGIRQALFSQHDKMSTLLSDDGIRTNGSGNNIISIGTAYGAKGQEWDSVVVIQGDIPYEQYNVMRDRLARLLYVALSRARKNLHILFTARPRDTGMFVELAASFGIRCSGLSRIGAPPPIFQLPQNLTVTDDLVQCALPMEVVQVATFDPIETPVTLAPDCLGLVVEHRLASYLNIPIPETLTIFPYRKRAPALFLVQSGCESLLRAGAISHESELEELLGPGDSLDRSRVCIEPYGPQCSAWSQEWREASLEKREFLLVKYSYSLLIGADWSLSDEIEALDLTGLRAVAELLGVQLPRNSIPLVRSVLRRVPITGERPSMILGYLTGETDIEQLNTTVFEVKHVATEALHAGHCRQALIYSVMMGGDPLPTAFVVNTKLGTLSLVSCKDTEGASHILRMARAKLASKQAHVLRVHLDSRRRERFRNSELRFDLTKVAPVLISVDIETYGSHILEVGAVAFSKDDGQILGVFHLLAAGVHPNPALEEMGNTVYTETGDDEAKHQLDWKNKLAATELLCGFGPVNEELAAADQDRIIRTFGEWLEGFPEHTMLQYGGSDLALLRCTSKNSIDVMQYYRIYLETQKTPGLPYRLGNAVVQLFGPGCFVPHRAFEDAVATMQVFMVIIGVHIDII